jgi:hypothetical protein
MKRTAVSAALLLAVILLAIVGSIGLGPLRGLFHHDIATSAHGGIVEVRMAPIPEGAAPNPFERSPSDRAWSLQRIVPFIPDPLPAPLFQGPACGMGGDLVVTFADGYEVTYGPCHRPASIDHLWAEIDSVMSHGACDPRCGPGGTPGP